MTKNVITLEMNRRYGLLPYAPLQMVRNRKHISVSFRNEALPSVLFLVELKAKMLLCLSCNAD